MKQLISLLFLVFAMFAAAADVAIPFNWIVETTKVNPASFEAYQGETLVFSAELQSRGKPLAVPENYSFYWQTNGMGSAYWVTNAAPVVHGMNMMRALWLPEFDVGASCYNCFIGKAGSIYHAAFQLRLRPSPGAVPNVLPLPRQKIDFAAVEIVNPSAAPWLMSETDPTVPAWAKNPTPPVTTETDPIWSAEKSGYETAQHAADTYQPKGSYLTSETDPTVPAWAKNPTPPAETDPTVPAWAKNPTPPVTTETDPIWNADKPGVVAAIETNAADIETNAAAIETNAADIASQSSQLSQMSQSLPVVAQAATNYTDKATNATLQAAKDYTDAHSSGASSITDGTNTIYASGKTEMVVKDISSLTNGHWVCDGSSIFVYDGTKWTEDSVSEYNRREIYRQTDGSFAMFAEYGPSFFWNGLDAIAHGEYYGMEYTMTVKWVEDFPIYKKTQSELVTQDALTNGMNTVGGRVKSLENRSNTWDEKVGYLNVNEMPDDIRNDGIRGLLFDTVEFSFSQTGRFIDLKRNRWGVMPYDGVDNFYAAEFRIDAGYEFAHQDWAFIFALDGMSSRLVPDGSRLLTENQLQSANLNLTGDVKINGTNLVDFIRAVIGQ